jgi:antitoxin HigA-1
VLSPLARRGDPFKTGVESRRIAATLVHRPEDVRRKLTPEAQTEVARLRDRMIADAERHQKLLAELMLTPTGRVSTHPGEMLLEEFLKPSGLSVADFVRPIGVAVSEVEELIAGRRSVTPELAVLFAETLGTSAEFWINLQALYDRTAAGLPARR